MTIDNITPEKLLTMILDAYSYTLSISDNLTNPQKSKNWVKYLAAEFRRHFNNSPDIIVFSRDFVKNKSFFKLNELLFDIHVCETKKAVTESKHSGELHFISQALWQIESEFARNRRDSFTDFSKLVVGNAQNKLFICPYLEDKEFIEDLKQIAICCNPCENVFLCEIPSPGEWQKKKKTTGVSLYMFKSNKWERISNAKK